MELLTTQLKNQDPLDPMKDTEFISQMANFTALEQTSEIYKTLTSMSSSMQLSNATTSYLGREVTLKSEDTTVKGSVSEVSARNGKTYVTISGKEYDASTITNVKNTTSPTSGGNQ